MKPKISIIVPVYNVEKYIERCLKSITEQTLKEIEIIVVDDGSVDNSGEICDSFSEKDNRIIVIHKMNEGVSAARNTGIAVSTGEYIGFVDSDDYISNKMFEILYKIAVNENADISMCEFMKIRDRDNDFDTIKSNLEYCVLNEQQSLQTVFDFQKNVQVAVWNKIFKRDTVKGIEFDTSKSMAEDLEYLIKAILNSKNFVYTKYALYGYYIQREGAATNLSHDHKWYLLQNRNITRIMEDLIKIRPQYKNMANSYKCVNGNLSIINAMVRSDYYEISLVKYIRKEIKHYLPVLIKSNLNLLKKVQLMLFVLSPKIYKMTMKKIVGA